MKMHEGMGGGHDHTNNAFSAVNLKKWDRGPAHINHCNVFLP